jgi:hypothetical protein
MRDSALNWLRGRQLGVDVKLGHTQAKAGMRPADGYFNSLLGMVGLNEFFKPNGGEQRFVITVRSTHCGSFHLEYLSIVTDRCASRQYFNSLLKALQLHFRKSY